MEDLNTNTPDETIITDGVETNTPVEDPGVYVPEANTGTPTTDFKTYLQEEYNKVVKSVYENQGFYVGRYETSNITYTDGTAIEVIAGALNEIRELNWYFMYAQQVEYATNKTLTSSSAQSAAKIIP